MPRLLTKETERYLNAATESLRLAVLGMSASQASKGSSERNAPLVGLVGVAAELAFSAIVVQHEGESSLVDENGRYKTAADVYAAVKRILGLAAPPVFLVDSIGDVVGHTKQLREAVTNLRPLINARAMALHGGHGVQPDLLADVGGRVADFLVRLAKSRRMRPYLTNVPRPAVHPIERKVLAEDLVARVKSGSAGSAAINLLLLMPDLLEDEPDWFSKVQAVVTKPSIDTASFLVKAYENAQTLSIARTASSGTALPVRFASGDPNALLVAPAAIKKSFSNLREEMDAAIAAANARLSRKELDLPPVELIRELFVVGLPTVRGETTPTLSAHEAWPFVAGSWAVQGTEAPWRFVVLAVRDHAQLGALLSAAAALSTHVGNHRKRLIGELKALGSTTVQPNDPLRESYRTEFADAESARGRLATYPELRALPANLQSLVREVSEGVRSPQDLMGELIALQHEDSIKWLRRVVRATGEPKAAGALVSAQKEAATKAIRTELRRALVRIDRVSVAEALGWT